MKKLLAILAIAAFALSGAVALRAQDAAHSIWSGVYTSAQANRGNALFTANCARCHELGLTGSDVIPPLGGIEFMSDWNGQSVAALVNRILSTMPADNPGKLSAAEATDLVAFILANNQIPPGTAELSSDKAVQQQLRIDVTKPGAN